MNRRFFRRRLFLGAILTFAITVFIFSNIDLAFAEIPVITMNGPSELIIYVGTVYTDLGATASDPVEGDLSSVMIVNNIVNTEDPGDYTVTYDVTNAAEAAAIQVVRLVHVFPLEEYQAVLNSSTNLDALHTEVVVGDNSGDATLNIPESVTRPTINFAALSETSGDNKIVTTTAELIIDVATGGSGNVNVTLPSGLVITGGSTWDGVINAPTNKLTDFVLPGGNLSSAIEVGLTDQSLTFNKAVRLLFAGKTSKRAGYDPGSGFHEITVECTADNQVTVDAQLSGNSECKFDNGVDLVVWTKHFTTFAAYTRAISSGGGSSTYVPPTASVPVAVIPPMVPPVVPTVPQGQVLGETLINSHPEGTFISIGKTIYIVSAGKKRPFATFTEFQSYGKVSVIKASEADQLLPDGEIVRAKSGTVATDLKDRRTIYVINEKGEKQGFATYAAFVKMKYKLSQVKRLDLSVYPTGEVIN